jgi:glycine/D-amino acid oxidase-like deaminating enzyme/nitrite reductase/ring-hydroxylating ferredoxin subunit
VGAGIAGLTTAYLLLRSGKSVVVVDRGAVGRGQTQRTTAHLSNAIDALYLSIEKLHGAYGAQLAAQSHSAAIDKIEEIVRREAISCGFERLDGYLFPDWEKDEEMLHKELEACHRAGLKDVELLRRFPLNNLRVNCCLRFPRQGQFHPLEYLFGLALAVGKAGGRIFTRTHIKRIDGGDSPRVQSEDGPEVTCSAVVVATNTPVNNRVAIHTKQAPYRTYAIAADIPEGAVPRALYWDTADPYHYVRLQTLTSEAGKKKVLLIVGGEDHKTGQDGQPEQRHRALDSWARARFPRMGRVEYAWSGQVMETIDGLAFIGRNPSDEANVFIATGDCGMGMTHGTIAGMLLTDLILQRDNPWSALYEPSRKTLRAAGTFGRENLNVAWQYTDWLTAGEVKSADEIAPEKGAVVRSGLHKLAVYRDGQGKLHRMSATCPHLGCIVSWNDLEETWDCPCHGSRFDRSGKVLCGPSVSNLAPVEEK